VSPRGRAATRLAVSAAPCLALAVEAAVFPLARTELSVILAAEAYGLAGFAVLTMWRFARHRLAVDPSVLAAFAAFVNVDYALTEDRVAGQRGGIVLAVYSAAAWAYFRFGPLDAAAPPLPDEQVEDTGQTHHDDGVAAEAAGVTADPLAVIRSRARQRIGWLALVNTALTVVALVAHLRPDETSGTVDTAIGTPGLSTGSGDTLTLITDTGNPGAPPVFAVTITLTVNSKKTGQLATAPRAINGEYEIASFTIDVQHGSFAYDARRFMFRSADGQIYPAENGNSAHAGFPPPPASVIVPAGQSLHGTLTFDVPRGGGEVVYNDDTGNPHPGWTTSR
jgi:hypothetical protein